jgi:predicted amidohydrolase
VSALAVAAIQHDIVWEDRDATLAHVEPLVRKAVEGGAQLVLLPELFAVGFTMHTALVAEEPDGPTASWLHEQAAGHGVWIGGSVPEVPDGADRPSNTFVLAAPGGEVHRYAKRHPFSFAGEHDHYAPGRALLTARIGDVRTSAAICYDLRFADQFWGQAPTTDLFVVVANWPAVRQAHWRTLLVARAIENQAYVVGVNRVGEAEASGGGLAHAGGSIVVDPFGEVVAEADDTEQVLRAVIDPDRVADIRTRFPFLADRT